MPKIVRIAEWANIVFSRERRMPVTMAGPPATTLSSRLGGAGNGLFRRRHDSALTQPLR